jgi:hypothetical protein
MQCSDIREKLSAYIEGVVSPEEKPLIDEHLKVCERCSESLADLKKALELVRNLEEVEPPPWMTQKVMARLRSETELRRGILQRLFYPLYIKLPIEALAVIFVALMSVHVYRTMQPEMKLAEAPLEEVGLRALSEEKQEMPAADRGKPTGQLVVAEKRAKHREEYRAPAKAMKPEPAAPSAGAVVRDEPEAEALPSTLRLARVGRVREGIRLSVNVKAIEAASEEIEKALVQLGGKIMKREHFQDRSLITAELDSERVEKLCEKLRLIGKLEDKGLAFEGHEGKVKINIEIVKTAIHP